MNRVDIEIATHVQMNILNRQSYISYIYKDISLRAKSDFIEIPSPDSELADITANIILDKPQLIGVISKSIELPIGPLQLPILLWLDLLEVNHASKKDLRISGY